MKQLFHILVLVLLANIAVAQAPQGIPYQAAARNSSGAVLASTAISVRFTVRDSIATGAIKYRETHSVTTTEQGMFSVNVGQGTVVTGTFSSINWGTNAKFMQVEMDPAGGSSYIELGTQQMMSVPYSIYSNNGMPTVTAVGDILYSNGTNWVKLPAGTTGQVLTIGGSGVPVWTAPPALGAAYGGGKIAYIFQPGDAGYVVGEVHGLIAAPTDQSTGIKWGCNSVAVGGTSVAVGAGAANTAIVSDICGAATAARLCDELVLNGYSDWYLPSLDELSKLYYNRIYIGVFASGHYWSSSENPPEFAYSFDFVSGNVSFGSGYYKSSTYYVRAVRAF